MSTLPKRIHTTRILTERTRRNCYGKSHVRTKKNGDEVYYITVYNGHDINGKKIKHTTTYSPDMSLTPKQREKSAKRFEMEYEDRIKSGVNMDGDKLTFKMYSEKWLEYMKDNLAYSTYEGYVINLNNHMIPFFGTQIISKIKTPMIEKFYKSMADDYTYGTIKKCNNILSGMFKTAIRWQMIEMNPCTNAIIPKNAKKKDDGLKFFTPEQSLMFLRSLDKPYVTAYKGHYRTDDTGKRYYVDDYTESRNVSTQYKVFYNIALFGGLRKGEILALDWDDIDFEKGIISITKSVSKSEQGVDVKDPKTATSKRTVTMPDNVILLLQTSATMDIYTHSFEKQKYEVSDKINEFLRKNA